MNLEEILDNDKFVTDLDNAFCDLSLEAVEPEDLDDGLKLTSDKGEFNRGVIKLDEHRVTIIKSGAESRMLYFDEYHPSYSSVEELDIRRVEIAQRRAGAVERREVDALKKVELFESVQTAYESGSKIEHRYLARKGICPADVRIDYRVATFKLYGLTTEWLLYRINDNAYQAIMPFKPVNGSDKRYVTRHADALEEAYAVIGEGEPKFIVEGFADAISANMATGSAVAIASSSGNVVKFAKDHPSLILLADNDDAGRKSAKESGLRAIYCKPHKDVDDYRRHEGLDALAVHIEQELSPIICDSQVHITVVSGNPGSGKSYQECESVLLDNGLTVYAVHNIAAMSQQEGSRVKELEAIAEDKGLDMPDVRRVYSDNEGTVRNQFNEIMKEYDGGHCVIFITHKALEMIDFTDAKGRLIIDEAPIPYEASTVSMTGADISNVRRYLNYVESVSHGRSIIKIEGLNQTGQNFVAERGNRTSYATKALWTDLNVIDKSGSTVCFWLLPDDNSFSDLALCVEYKVTKCRVLDANVFRPFEEVRLLSDDAENSLFVKVLANTQGVTYDLEQLSTRYDVVGKVKKIIGITRGKLSKYKLDIRPNLSNLIARELANEVNMDNALWLLNNANREAGDAVAYLEEKGYEVAHYNPMTHGRNDLTEFETVIMCYSLKPGPEELAILTALGLGMADITRWREHNVHMQNMFRCSLRVGREATWVLPDSDSVDYALERMKDLTGEDLSEKVVYLDNPELIIELASKPAGREKLDGESLSGAERTKASKWRETMPYLNEVAKDIGGIKPLLEVGRKQAQSFYDVYTYSPEFKSEEYLNIQPFSAV
ncbi:Conserved hypothetical protein [Shewanella piezotolerans WP3]|uniref:Toprim domain-containing protein n=1 Tax=Shewanella piezotolerans (strain WP3 / JCM 13877) TaxID=225849 RepID=B8CRC7_SHEPW|nr:toprim domain-containing protein [Shewanella piezotolerans]ACJ29935.1 Conserved hypothetical protein [Shewanella piezotolerans WP3]